MTQIQIQVYEKLIALSSSTAELLNGTKKSNVLFTFQNILKEEPDIERALISVESAQFPVSFYNVNTSNNTLKINVTGTTTTLTLTVGNYNSTTLVEMLQTVFTSAGLTGFTFLYSTITGKLTITKTPLFTITASGSTCLGFLGYDTTTDTTGTSLTGTSPLNLLGSLRIKVVSTTLNTFNVDSAFKGGVSLLGTIPINSGNFGLILYENNSLTDTELRDLDINNIDIQLIDDYGNFFDFNNIDWAITLKLHVERGYLEKSKTQFRDVVARPDIASMVNDLEQTGTGNIIEPIDNDDDLYDLFYDNGITL